MARSCPGVPQHTPIFAYRSIPMAPSECGVSDAALTVKRTRRSGPIGTRACRKLARVPRGPEVLKEGCTCPKGRIYGRMTKSADPCTVTKDGRVAFVAYLGTIERSVLS